MKNEKLIKEIAEIVEGKTIVNKANTRKLIQLLSKEGYLSEKEPSEPHDSFANIEVIDIDNTVSGYSRGYNEFDTNSMSSDLRKELRENYDSMPGVTLEEKVKQWCKDNYYGYENDFVLIRDDKEFTLEGIEFAINGEKFNT